MENKQLTRHHSLSTVFCYHIIQTCNDLFVFNQLAPKNLTP